MKQPQKWLVLEEDKYIHIVPDFDTRPHANVLTPIEGKFELSADDCSCNPEIVTEDEEGEYKKPVIIHNSFFVAEQVDKNIKRLLRKLK